MKTNTTVTIFLLSYPRVYITNYHSRRIYHTIYLSRLTALVSIFHQNNSHVFHTYFSLQLWWCDTWRGGTSASTARPEVSPSIYSFSLPPLLFATIPSTRHAKIAPSSLGSPILLDLTRSQQLFTAPPTDWLLYY